MQRHFVEEFLGFKEYCLLLSQKNYFVDKELELYYVKINENDVTNLTQIKFYILMQDTDKDLKSP